MRRVYDIPATEGHPDGAHWEVVTHDDFGDHVHVLPLNDLIEHNEEDDDGDCVCGTTIELVEREDGDRWLIVHDSLDGREQLETGTS